MTEYRLDELAATSGVSTRNIRAYRERGLLDPPRRQGRSALYSDRHLSQLRIINELLRRGFTSAHIADFLASTRRGDDLAGTLGLQPSAVAPTGCPEPVGVDPESAEARRLLDYGLAEVVDGHLTLVDPNIAEMVGRTSDPHHGVQTILKVTDGIAGLLDELASVVARALAESARTHVRRGDAAAAPDAHELRQMVEDHRTLGVRVVTHRLATALRRHLDDESSTHTAGLS